MQRAWRLSLEEVFGVSTFYSQFSLTPKGKYNVSICLGTACYVKGAAAVLDKLTSALGIQPEEVLRTVSFHSPRAAASAPAAWPRLDHQR